MSTFDMNNAEFILDIGLHQWVLVSLYPSCISSRRHFYNTLLIYTMSELSRNIDISTIDGRKHHKLPKRLEYGYDTILQKKKSGWNICEKKKSPCHSDGGSFFLIIAQSNIPANRPWSFSSYRCHCQ